MMLNYHYLGILSTYSDIALLLPDMLSYVRAHSMNVCTGVQCTVQSTGDAKCRVTGTIA